MINKPPSTLVDRLKAMKAKMKPPAKGKKPKKVETINKPGGSETPGAKAKRNKARVGILKKK